MPAISVVGQEIKPASNEHASPQKRFAFKVETRKAVQLGTTRGGKRRCSSMPPTMTWSSPKPAQPRWANGPGRGRAPHFLPTHPSSF